MRYMYLVYGIQPYSANGNTVVSNYSGTTLTAKTHPATDGLPTPGDILSFAANTFGHGATGHTAVVTGYNKDNSGNVTSLVVLQQKGASF
jgi:hypothetical protein